MLQPIKLDLGEWLPGKETYNNPGCLIANNCVPGANGYQPLPSMVATADSVTGTCMGAALFFNEAEPFIAGGTEDSLFWRSGGTVEETTGYVALPADEFWCFAQFGDIIVATSSTNAPQYLTSFADDTWSALTGSPPTARFCARVGDFLMLGNLSTGTNGIAWSHFNSPTGAWAASRLTQAGTAELPTEFGGVQAIVGGRYGLIFQERAISRLTYVGPPVIWDRQEVEKDRGTIAPGSVVTVGYTTFFLSQDGFWATNGSEMNPIGGNRINRWFFENANQSKLSWTHAAVDWQRQCIVWAFVSSDSEGFDRLLFYSWEQNRWSSATVDLEYLVGSRQDGTTLEDLDALFPSGLETVDPPLDSEFWKAGNRSLAAFQGIAGESTYSTFNGPNMAAEWKLGGLQPKPGRRVYVSRIHPIYEGEADAMETQVVQEDNVRQEDASSDWNTTGSDVAGWGGSRGDGWTIYPRMRSMFASDWTSAQGMIAEYRTGGRQ